MRGKRALKRQIKPDPKYNSTVIAKFINQVMRRGKKSVAEKIVYGAFDILSAAGGAAAAGEKQGRGRTLDIFDKAIKNVSPEVEVRSKRIGGANYQIPWEVRGDRRNTLAFRWLIQAAKARRGKPMAEKLAMELKDAASGQGAAVKKKEDTYKMAQANRAFAHFAR